MYPYFRAFRLLAQAKFGKKMSLEDKGVIKLRVWFSDIDIYPELNNGRHLTLMDIGRFDFGMRIGLFKVLKEQNWGLMVAGNFTRYRRRLMFLKSFQLETEIVGYDDKWFYFYQKTVRKEMIHSAALIRTAVVSKKGIVPAKEVAKAMKVDYNPDIPRWVEDWIELHHVSPEIVV